MACIKQKLEIDKYLEDVMSVEKEIQCLECEKWLEEIRKKSTRIRKIKNNSNNPIRKDNKEVYKLVITNSDITI